MATFTSVPTPDGPFLVLSDNGVVFASGWTNDRGAVVARLHPSQDPLPLTEGGDAAVFAAVEAYYAGEETTALTIPVQQVGTPLQLRGWETLRTIPAGEPLSYSEFASALGSPRAVRAAASICARNAAALFIPCHRVLRSDGSLGGFAWGTSIKESLLRREATIPLANH